MVAIEQIENLLDIARFDEAHKHAGRWVAEYPDHGYGYALLCRACLGLDNAPDAERHIRRALSLEPDEGYFHFLYSIVALRLKHFEPARKHAETAVKFDPENDQFLLQLFYMHLQNGELKQGEIVANQLVALVPDAYEAHQAKGEVCHKLERYKEAGEHFAIALSRSPENDYLQYSLAYCQLETKQYQDAVLNMLNLVKRNPADHDYANELYRMICRFKGKSKDKNDAFWQQLPRECRVFYEQKETSRGFTGRWAKWLTITSWLVVLAGMVWLFSVITPQ